MDGPALIIVVGAACILPSTVKHSCSQNVEGFNHERMRSLQVGQELSTAARSSWRVCIYLCTRRDGSMQMFAAVVSTASKLVFLVVEQGNASAHDVVINY